MINPSALQRLLVLLLLAIASLSGCTPGLLPTPPPPVQPAGPRQVVILSDLHLGLGQTSPGRWDPYEDFRFADALQGVLAQLDAVGQGRTDLILAGDLLELWRGRTAWWWFPATTTRPCSSPVSPAIC